MSSRSIPRCFLGYFLRLKGYKVEFEKPLVVPRPDGSTKPPKTNLDLLVDGPGARAAIELKVPLNKRHPETLYDYCADIEFIEALLRNGEVDEGLCLLMRNDHVFWEDSGRGSRIHDFFRRSGGSLTERIDNPTGPKNTAVVLTGRYQPANLWRRVGSTVLM